MKSKQNKKDQDDENLYSSTESSMGSSGHRDVGIQVSAMQDNKATQAGKPFTRGSLLYRMFSTMKSDSHIVQEKEETDPMVRAFGHFGRWHFLVQCMLFLSNISYVFQLVIDEYENSLFGEFWCARPDHLKKIPIDLWKDISGIYKLNAAGVTVYDPCFKKNLKYEKLNLNDPETLTVRGENIRCTSWEYADEQSILSEWQLACRTPSASSASAMMFALGGIKGALANGYIMDRFGRRTYLIYCLFLNGLISYLTALSPYYEVYLLLRGAQGFFTIGSMELSGKKWIGLIGSTFMFSFPIGYVVCTIAAQNLNNWRHLHYAASALSIFLLSGWWIIPESPRWLWLQKRITQLLGVIEDALVMNGTPELSQQTIHLLKNTGPMKYPVEELTVRLSDLFKTKTIRKISFVSVLLFFLIFLPYYGSVLKLNKMFNPENIFRYQLFTGIIEFTATAVCLSLLARKWLNDSLVLFFSSISAGILFLFVNAIPNDSVGITVCLIGIRFFMSIVNTNLLNYVAELYPTKMRGIGITFAHFFSFLAFLVTGYGFSLDKIKQGLTIFLMGMSGVIGAFLFLLLPQPDNKSIIIDTIDQDEDYFMEGNVD